MLHLNPLPAACTASSQSSRMGTCHDEAMLHTACRQKCESRCLGFAAQRPAINHPKSSTARQPHPPKIPYTPIDHHKTPRAAVTTQRPLRYTGLDFYPRKEGTVEKRNKKSPPPFASLPAASIKQNSPAPRRRLRYLVGRDSFRRALVGWRSSATPLPRRTPACLAPPTCPPC